MSFQRYQSGLNKFKEEMEGTEAGQIEVCHWEVTIQAHRAQETQVMIVRTKSL
jgi:hypothetical protein